MSSNFWLADEQFDKTSSHFRTSRVACRVWMTGACCLASYSASSEAIAGPLPGSAIAQRMSREGDVPAEFGSVKTLYNRCKRGSEAGVFERVFEVLARDIADLSTLMIPSHRNCVSTAGQRI